MTERLEEPSKRELAHTIADHSNHEMIQIAVGLAAMLWLQYAHEGHLDEHISQLLVDVLHVLELRLANIQQTELEEYVPF